MSILGLNDLRITKHMSKTSVPTLKDMMMTSSRKVVGKLSLNFCAIFEEVIVFFRKTADGRLG